MGTEEDLRRFGRAARALADWGAARAAGAARELAREAGRTWEQTSRRATPLVDEGRRVAADVVGTVRRDVGLLFDELGHPGTRSRPGRS